MTLRNLDSRFFCQCCNIDWAIDYITWNTEICHKDY